MAKNKKAPKSKYRPAVKVIPAPKKKVVEKAFNHADLVAGIQAILSDPKLNKALLDALNTIAKSSITTAPVAPVLANKDFPPDTLGHMIPADVIPAPIDAAPEVVVDAPAVPIIVEDRTAEAVVQIPAPPGYRGELMEISKLLGIVDPVACEVIDTQIAETKVGTGKINKVKMASLIILTGVNSSALGNDAKSITYAAYLGEFKVATRDVLNTLVVKKLTGVQGAKMLNAYKEHRLKNFEAGINHDGIEVGCEPEVFVANKEGLVVPAFELLDNKAESKIVSAGAMGGKKVYHSNFAARLETRSNHCLAYHIDGIQEGLKAALKQARTTNKDAVLSSKSVIDVVPGLLDDKYVALACDPSLNVYGLKNVPVNPRTLLHRSAGGFLRFGGISTKPGKLEDGVKALDAILAVACVSLFRNLDNPKRRELVGKAGEYVFDKDVLEYRTISPCFLAHPVLAHMVFELGRKALMVGLSGYRNVWVGSEKEIVETIQNCDVLKATALLKANEVIFRRILSTTHMVDPGGKKQTDIAFNAFMTGCEQIISNPNDLTGNWRLEDKWTSHSMTPRTDWDTSVKEFAKGIKV
jgi:hypothetical protein